MAGERAVGKQPGEQTDNQRTRLPASQGGADRQAGRQTPEQDEQVERQAGARIQGGKVREVGGREDTRGEAGGRRGTWTEERRAPTSRSTGKAHLQE